MRGDAGSDPWQLGTERCKPSTEEQCARRVHSFRLRVSTPSGRDRQQRFGCEETPRCTSLEVMRVSKNSSLSGETENFQIKRSAVSEFFR